MSEPFSGNHALFVIPREDGTFTLIDPASPPPPHRPTAVGLSDDDEREILLWQLRDVLAWLWRAKVWWANHGER